MPELLNPELPASLDPDEEENLRVLNRTPHPYHHQSFEIPYSSDVFGVRHGAEEQSESQDGAARPSPTGYPSFTKESSPTSDSGTEADDEHFLRGLPAPKVRLHKGLRGRNEPLSGTITPQLSPAILEEDGSLFPEIKGVPKETSTGHFVLEALRRKRIWVRRAAEVAILGVLGDMVRSNALVAPIFDARKKDFKLFGFIYGGLLAIYPFRIAIWAYQRRRPSRRIPIDIPLSFDPAPLLYPPAITVLVSLLVSTDNPAVILPNIILAISTIPREVVPTLDVFASYDTTLWGLTTLLLRLSSTQVGPSTAFPTKAFVSGETLVLLYPLHRTLCDVLHYLTTTSLLSTELQLLSVALINVLLLASSPQVLILKALLWVGGVPVLVFCGTVIRWGITLARVPKWRLRKAGVSPQFPYWKEVSKLLSLHRMKNDLLGSAFEGASHDVPFFSDEEEDTSSFFKPPSRVRTLGPAPEEVQAEDSPSSPEAGRDNLKGGLARRHTLSHSDKASRKNTTHTPSGRKKRSMSISLRPYVKLTYEQAVVRKWAYASYVYVCMAIIIVAGVRVHIQRYALAGNEPIGWTLGYLFGNLSWFRFQVVSANLEYWICLPPRLDPEEDNHCHMGWVEHLRHDDFGESNTRLLIGLYWLVVLVMGLVVVFQLQGTYEVDTRRKVFHFTMVGMLLPAVFVDPTLAALVLSIVLAIFLILDLLRASQLPPLSKPIASFLAPYVDGRDFRGPVVISHIFLLIGCAIPLWLALAALPRVGSGYLAGWEVPTRDVSMVSGVVCVGLGDAAASLIGRRYGHHKWLWGGGKSLEGSVAFAFAVLVGLFSASMWLRVGAWTVSDAETSLLAGAVNAGVCGTVASLTEAVLTGGNDNVIVPVVLWTCVKSLGI